MPVNTTAEFVQQLMEQNLKLTAQNETLLLQVTQLTEKVDKLTRLVKELQEKTNKNSKNSSKPPSSDGLKKPPVNKDQSLRQKEGKTWWVHNASDRNFTYLTIHRKRGQVGMDAAGVLPEFYGITVHDCWGSYWKYPEVTHAICCAHLLWELKGVEENHPEQTWATKFKELLLTMINRGF